eukprot:CAMPEP_0172298652 /NCGR_PEP_ID=MMETSP1058-20130122/1204_1 /TAXON_ID=83371 /ORGANISM="Detonula confervacea, Strain CCMP 353" /LENGTH=2322 /DNA_ID=CAMNT_0013007933 /DNA_START=216 /DNA_END=7184 /DNA_ORIENTATION=-
MAPSPDQQLHQQQQQRLKQYALPMESEAPGGSRANTNNFVSYNMQQLPYSHQHPQHQQQMRMVEHSPSPNRPGCSSGLKNFVIPQCMSSYGQGTNSATSCAASASAAAHQAAACSNNNNRQSAMMMAAGASVPPVEDVMRWKEFRRRQKMEMQQQQQAQAFYTQGQQHIHNMQEASDGGEGQQQQQQQQQHQDHGIQSQNSGGSGGRILLCDKISAEDDLNIGNSNHAVDTEDADRYLPHLDSLSLSMSDSPMGNNKQPSSGTSAANTAKLSSLQQSHENMAFSQRATTDIASTTPSAIEIDPEGFPLISPTSLNSEELQQGRSSEMEDDIVVGNNMMSHQQQQQPLRPQQVQVQIQAQPSNRNINTGVDTELEGYFTTLDCSVDAMRRESGRNNTSISSRSSDVASSEVPTELAANTARYVANQSNLMARRMMMNPVPSSTVSASSSSFVSVSLASSVVAGGGRPAPLSVSTLLSTPTAANALPKSNSKPQLSSSTKAASGRMKLAATPAGGDSTPLGYTPSTPSFDSPGWDATNTTVANNLLESVMATPKELEEYLPLPPLMEPILEPVGTEEEEEGENEKDVNVSTVSSNWDPLHVSTIQEGENNERDVSMVSSNWDPLHVTTIQEDDDDDMGFDKGGDGAVASNAIDVQSSPDKSTTNAKPSPSDKSRDSEQSGNSNNSSPSSFKNDDDVPTMDKVNNFMNQLKQLQNENSSPTSKRKKTPKKSTKKPLSSSASPTKKVEGMVHLPVATEHEVILTEENIEFTRSLMERKEKLRKHKVESERKKKEFDERLKAIRNKCYDESVVGVGMCDESIGGGESKTSMLPGVDMTPVKATSMSSIDKTPTNKLPENSCFPTDEKGPSSNPTTVRQGGTLPAKFSPLVPAARWSGGLARWGSSPNNNDANTSCESPSQPLPQKAQQVKLNIAVDEDDFSFKPPSIVGAGAAVGGGSAKNICISPIVAAGGFSKHRFNFTLSPEDKKKSQQHQPQAALAASLSSPMNTLLTTIGNATSSKKQSYSPNSKISLSPVSSKRSRSMPTPNNGNRNHAAAEDVFSFTPKGQRQPYVQKLSPPETPTFSAPIMVTSPPSGKLKDNINYRQQSTMEPSPSNISSSPINGSNAPSPDMSEGDKGGGIGFGHMGIRSNGLGDCKSIVSRSSSRFVELGQTNASQDPPDEDDESELNLLGVTVKGSKKKKRKKKRAAPFFETVDELESNCGSSIQEQESESLASNNEHAHDDGYGNNNNSRKPLDPDGFDWKELELKREESIAAAAVANHHQQPRQWKEISTTADADQLQQKKINPTPAPFLDFVPENGNEGFVAVIDRVKTTTPTEEVDFQRVETNAATFQQPPEQQQEKQFNLTPVLSIDIVDPEMGSTADNNEIEEFVAVMDRVKTCLTPRETKATPKNNYHSTSKGVVEEEEEDHFGFIKGTTTTMASVPLSQAPSRFGSKKVVSSGSGTSIHDLRSMFESSESVPSVLRNDSPKRKTAPSTSEVRSHRLEQPSGGTTVSSSTQHWRDIGRSFKSSKKEVLPETKPESSGYGDGTASSAWKSYNFGGRSTKESKKGFLLAPPESALDVEIQGVTSEEEVNDTIDPAHSKSSDNAVSIRELRSRFESQKIAAAGEGDASYLQKSFKDIRQEPSSQMLKGSTMIGSGIYLKNREIQAMSSLGCETHDTGESSNKSEENEGTVSDGTVGDGTLDTKKVLRYAKILERRGEEDPEEENESIKSFENSIEKMDTSNSSKENNVVKAVDNSNTATANNNNNDADFPNFSPVKMRKKAFESQKPRTMVAQAHEQMLKTPERNKASSAKSGALSLSPKKDVPPPNVATTATPMQAETQATSVKDRIAVFGKNTTPIKIHPRQQQAAPNKVVVPLQQQAQIAINRGPSKVVVSLQQQSTVATNRGLKKVVPLQQQSASPPRTIAMNHRATSTPSPLWIANRKGQAFSPIDKPVYGNNISPHVKSNGVGSRLPSNNNRSPPVRFLTPPHQMKNTTEEVNPRVDRPAPVQTRYKSPIAHEYDDDEDDGITLSPTFSEVSGLTLPTCLGTVNGDAAPRVSVQSDLFDNLSKNGTLFHETMSPIARHRKQQYHETMSPLAMHKKRQEKLDFSPGAKITSHPYLQRVNSKQNAAPSTSIETSIINDSADRLHELKTPRARGSPGISQGNKTVSRREQIVSRVRASPRHKSFPQQLANNANPNPSKARSQEWQERNAMSTKPKPSKAMSQEWQEKNMIEEQDISLSSSGDKSPLRHFDGRGGKASEKSKGRVADSVERVNRRMKKVQGHSTQQHQIPSKDRARNYGDAQNEDQGNSLATQDCIRID